MISNYVMPLSSAVQAELVGDEKGEDWLTDTPPICVLFTLLLYLLAPDKWKHVNICLLYTPIITFTASGFISVTFMSWKEQRA